MSSGGRYSRRRRSQSVSSSSHVLFTADDPKWRISTKRSRPSHPMSPSYKDLVARGEPPEKWDVDQWRRGKRARRDTSAREKGCGSYMLPISPASSADVAQTRLPSSSAAFGLYPERSSRRARRVIPRGALAYDGMSYGANLLPSGELDQLHSRAVSELQRSVADSSEGEIQRLRDLEHSRAQRCDASSRHRRPHADSPVLHDVQAEVVSDEEDDIEIVSSEAPSGSAYFHNRGPPCKKRALSLNMMDIDDIPDAAAADSSPSLSAEPSERCSSPFSAVTGPSAYSSDDDMSAADSAGPSRYSAPHAPGLTNSYTPSSNQSCASLSPSIFSPVSLPTPGGVHVPVSASRPEKAVAVLTLAMANGACSIEDYSAIQQMRALDDSHTGDLFH